MHVIVMHNTLYHVSLLKHMYLYTDIHRITPPHFPHHACISNGSHCLSLSLRLQHTTIYSSPRMYIKCSLLSESESHILISMEEHTYTHAYTHTYIDTYTNTHVTYTYIQSHTQTHTHTHTHTQARPPAHRAHRRIRRRRRNQTKTP
jgi:hypothetical protein